MLKYVLDNYEDIPEGLGSYYKQGDDEKWYLQVSGVVPQSELDSVNKTLRTERKNRKEYQKKAEKFDQVQEDLGEQVTIDELVDISKLLPEDYTTGELEKALENIKGNEGEDPPQSQIEKIRERERQKWQRELDKYKSENGTIKKSLERKVIDSELQSALGRNNVPPAYMKAAIALIKSEYGAEMQDEGDGNFKGMIKDTVEPIGDFVDGWVKSEEGKAFVSASKNSGGGSDPKSGSATKEYGGKNPFTKKHFNLTKQGELYKNNRELYNRLKREAEASEE